MSSTRIAPPPAAPPPSPRRIPVVLAVLLLTACVFGAFWPALTAEFVSWDDEQNITVNYGFRGLDREHLAWMFTTNRMGPYQPLSWLSLALDHALWGLSGPHEFPEAGRYHLTNVLIHALCAAAFLLLARRILALVFESASVSALDLAALVAALCFAVHPLRVESVAWVTERRDVLCGLFYVLTAHAWLGLVSLGQRAFVDDRRLGVCALLSLGGLAAAWLSLDLSHPQVLALGAPGWPGIAVSLALLGVAIVVVLGARTAPALCILLLFLCALLSKGLALVLPALLVLLDLWPLGRVKRRGDLLRSVAEKAPLLALSLVFARLANWGQSGIPGLFISFEEHTLAERLIQSVYGLVFYPWKTLAPVELSPIYILPLELSLAEWRFKLALAIVSAVVIALLAARRRALQPFVVLACYAVAVAPVLGLKQAGPQIVADRYSYLSCLPFALVAGGLYLRASALGAAFRWIAGGIAGGVVLALAHSSWKQTQVWTNSRTLWEHAREIDSLVPMTHLNLAHERMRAAQRERDPARRAQLFGEAEAIFERGRTESGHPLFLSGLAQVWQRRYEDDPSHAPALAQRSLELMEQASALARDKNQLTPEYRLNLGCALFNAGRYAEALTELEAYVEQEPQNVEGLFNLGFALVRARSFERARVELETALGMQPNSVKGWGYLAVAYRELGRHGDEERAFESVLRLEPGHPTATQELQKLRAARP